MKLFSEVSVSVLHEIVSLFRHDEHTLYLTSVKIDHPEMAKICLS